MNGVVHISNIYNISNCLVLVGTRLDEQPHDLEVTFLASDAQRRITMKSGTHCARRDGAGPLK